VKPSAVAAGLTAGPIRQLVIQGTPYCNIDCGYCYLPDRSSRARLPIVTVHRIAQVIAASGLLAEEIDVRWHAGEPLTLDPGFYDRAAAEFSAVLGSGVSVRHSIQTNGLFLNDSWMQLFKKWNFRVGVSIDGPAHIHDQWRKTRKGNGTHAAVARRLGLFAEHGVDFDVISVITPVTLDHADDYLAYMTGLAPRSLGINVEESEGPHTSSALADTSFLGRFRAFAGKLAAWSADTGIPVRELRSIDQIVRNGATEVRNTQNVPGAIMTVTADGTLSTFSPELAGQQDPRLRSLPIGNVFDPDILAKIANCGSGRIADSIRTGVARCRSECEYFMFCGGGAPANKFYENGTFASTATLQCRTTVMAFAEAYLTVSSARDTAVRVHGHPGCAPRRPDRRWQHSTGPARGA
jgi:uncharacterized protein